MIPMIRSRVIHNQQILMDRKHLNETPRTFRRGIGYMSSADGVDAHLSAYI